MAFLEHRDGRPLTIEAPEGFRPRELHLGSGAGAPTPATVRAEIRGISRHGNLLPQ